MKPKKRETGKLEMWDLVDRSGNPLGSLRARSEGEAAVRFILRMRYDVRRRKDDPSRTRRS